MAYLLEPEALSHLGPDSHLHSVHHPKPAADWLYVEQCANPADQGDDGFGTVGRRSKQDDSVVPCRWEPANVGEIKVQGYQDSTLLAASLEDVLIRAAR